MRVSYKDGEVQDENSTAAKGNRQNLILAEASSVMPIAVKEAWAISQICLILRSKTD